MATVFKVRSGSAFKTTIEYRQPDEELVDTTGFTATIQIRAGQPNGRIILVTNEVDDPSPAGTVLTRIEPGSWYLFFGKSLTRTFPPTAFWELELVNDSNPEDIVTLASGVIKTEPEGVIEVD